MSKRQKHLLLAVGVVITFVITGLFDQINFFYSWEAQLHDQTLRLTQDTLPDSNIFLILLDNASYSIFGGSKANMRHELAKLIRDLSAAGTKTIVLDLIFDELTSPEADSALSRVIDSTGTVVLCANFLETDRISDQTISPITQKYNLKIGNIERIDFRSQAALNFAIFPHEILNKRCSYLGSIANEVDLDNNERAITLIVYYNDIFFPALGLSALLHYFGETDNSFAIRKTLLTHYFEITSSNRKISIPINRKGQVLLNYYGPIEVFDRISFLEMKNLLSAYQSEQIKPINLKNKIVIIGSVETGWDRHLTPFSPEFPGIGMHATFMSNVLQDYFITKAPWYFNAIISLVFILILFFLFNTYLTSSKSLYLFAIISLMFLFSFNLVYFKLIYPHLKIWLKLLQINLSFLIYLGVVFYYEKNVRLKSLKRDMIELEKSLETKKKAFEIITTRLKLQSEQLKVVKYFTNELRKIFLNPDLNYENDEIYSKLFENEALLREKLDQEIIRLKEKKEAIDQERTKLEIERNFYKKMIEGSEIEKIKPIKNEAKVDKIKLVKEVMGGYQFFQKIMEKKSADQFCFYEIAAFSEIEDDGGLKIQTKMGKIFEKIRKISQYKSTVLITGEHGTGKELIAKAIVACSEDAASSKMITVNCAAIPEQLLESELFGHVKGAFTDAKFDRIGAFEAANGGTIFLDEIAELKPEIQAKLLRVIQNREIQKVGSTKSIPIDVRVIAATNRNLQQMIQNNEFREDLYFRLKVVTISLPPLRDRKYDIPLLVHLFLNDLNHRYEKQKAFTEEAVIAMMCYPWQGNVRELQNLVESLFIETYSDNIKLSDLPTEIQSFYVEIYESTQIPMWERIRSMINSQKEHFLELCKIALKENQVDHFLSSNDLNLNNKQQTNLFDYFKNYIDQIASTFPEHKREEFVREVIILIQNELFQWCRQQKIGKLGELYDPIQKILGRSRRQIDSWKSI